ncbi:hypothetical protein NSIN_40237 [Nitrosotalea sinensis]|uniref:Uncharacterized protein n=1 Tax=Nitrosotalea sinensis TaxID=1499975 RepID=A0A2H1EJE8_9ARCH|nr:hypothetical protein [Candidatus Nitrosotalea sinensis]SHO47811.1 hypothetical protein NSIN_40237 [Candidatus Nitrosotalea sinensis]
MPTLSEILEVRKGKHGIVEITAVQLPTSLDGKSEEVDLVARHGKLNQPYEVIINSKTKEKKFLQEPEINGERCFFVDDDKGGNWLAMFL